MAAADGGRLTKKIPDNKLNPLEKALRAKSYFTTRAGKYFDRPAVAINGSMGYSNLYSLGIEQRPFPSDAALLDAYNASMFTEFREVNMGTLDAFMYDYESEFNQEWLKKQKLSDALANNVLKLGNLFRTRTQALPEKSKRCTIFSPSQRNENWMRSRRGEFRTLMAQKLCSRMQSCLRPLPHSGSPPFRLSDA